MKVLFTGDARRDLLALHAFIARDNPGRAGTYVVELVTRCETLVTFPARFPRAVRRGKRTIRKMTHEAYLVFYAVRVDHIEIIRILHGSRDWRRIVR